jgi:hypothetical protein
MRLQRLVLELCSAEHPCTKLTHARQNSTYTLAAQFVVDVRVWFFLLNSAMTRPWLLTSSIATVSRILRRTLPGRPFGVAVAQVERQIFEELQRLIGGLAVAFTLTAPCAPVGVVFAKLEVCTSGRNRQSSLSLCLSVSLPLSVSGIAWSLDRWTEACLLTLDLWGQPQPQPWG